MGLGHRPAAARCGNPLAILRNKVKTMGVEIPEDVLTFLANRIRTNIRRLEAR